MRTSIILFLKIFCALYFLFIQNLNSQNFIDLASAGTIQIPKTNYKDTTGSFKFSINYVNLQYPHVFANKDVFNSKLSFNQYTIKDSATLQLYVMYLQLGFLKNINDKVSLRFAVYPEISSQLKDVDKNDFLMPCVAIMQWKKSENFTYGFGLMYSREFFGNFLVPMIHAKWRINDSWFFYADFPSYGYLMYYPKKRFRTGIYISSTTSSIRLSEKYNSTYIQKSNTDFSFFFDLYFTKNIVLRTKGGYTAMRSLDLYAKDDKLPLIFSVFSVNDERTQLNNNIKAAPFIEVSLNYRLHY